MAGQDIDYYSRREQQERETAARSDDLAARRVHHEMAERYLALRLAASPVQAR